MPPELLPDIPHPFGIDVTKAVLFCWHSSWMGWRPESAAMIAPVDGAVHCPAMYRPDSPGSVRSKVRVLMLFGVICPPSGKPCQLTGDIDGPDSPRRASPNCQFEGGCPNPSKW